MRRGLLYMTQRQHNAAQRPKNRNACLQEEADMEQRCFQVIRPCSQPADCKADRQHQNRQLALPRCKSKAYKDKFCHHHIKQRLKHSQRSVTQQVNDGDSGDQRKGT